MKTPLHATRWLRLSALVVPWLWLLQAVDGARAQPVTPTGMAQDEVSAPSVERDAGAEPAVHVTADLAGQPPRGVRGFTLTISGGLSLGNYEAGMNWALLEARKKSGNYRFEAATGASAGAINALLSALLWCAKEPSQLEDNLFRNVWLPVGFPELLPQDTSEPDELVMSRAISHEQARQITRDFVESHEFDPRCEEIKLGFTVTGERPIFRELGNLKAASNYFVVPLAMTIEEGRPVFRADEAFLKAKKPGGAGQGEPLHRNALGLALPGEQVPFDTVVDAIVASSAFPIAFSPVPLSYAWLDGKPCEENCSMDFSDGGVFDNVPLGLARDLAPNTENIYFSPDVRRLPAEGCVQRKTADQEPLDALDRTLTIYGSALSSARSRVLFETLGQIAAAGEQPVLPSRFAPITGDLMGAFGAWLDRNYREYDFLAGVYDGVIFQTVPSSCVRVGSPQQRVSQELEVASAAQLIAELGITGELAEVLQGFGRLEQSWGDPAATRQNLAGDSALAQVRRVMFEYHLDKGDGRPRVTDGFCSEEQSVESLLQGLSATGYAPDPSDVFAQAAANDVEYWRRPIVARALYRLVGTGTLLSAPAQVVHATATYPFDPERSLELKLDLQTVLREEAEYRLQPGIGWISETGVFTGVVGLSVGVADEEARLGGFVESVLRGSEVLAMWVQLLVEYGVTSEQVRLGGTIGPQALNLLRAGFGLHYWLNDPEKGRYGPQLEVSAVLALKLETLYALLF